MTWCRSSTLAPVRSSSPSQNRRSTDISKQHRPAPAPTGECKPCSIRHLDEAGTRHSFMRRGVRRRHCVHSAACKNAGDAAGSKFQKPTTIHLFNSFVISSFGKAKQPHRSPPSWDQPQSRSITSWVISAISCDSELVGRRRGSKDASSADHAHRAGPRSRPDRLSNAILVVMIDHGRRSRPSLTRTSQEALSSRA
jgi:hypothetical protein